MGTMPTFQPEFMMTSSNGNIFRVTGHLCGEFTGLRWIPRSKASDAELWCFFDRRLNKRLSKPSWGWWFETLSCPSWRHCNVHTILSIFFIFHAYVYLHRPSLVQIMVLRPFGKQAIIWTYAIHIIWNLGTNFFQIYGQNTVIKHNNF